MTKFSELLAVMDRLREECPWDREQTIESLRNNTIEEVYELSDAIADKDWDAIKGELGDVLLHVIFYAKIASEQGRFTMDDVIQTLIDKLVYRHPHVFGDVSVKDSNDVSQNWEALKKRERKGGVMSGVPRGLPAMVKAWRIGQKASSAGFADKPLEEDFGDVFFALINAARLSGIDPEMALERANCKFIEQIEQIERKENGTD